MEGPGNVDVCWSFSIQETAQPGDFECVYVLLGAQTPNLFNGSSIPGSIGCILCALYIFVLIGMYWNGDASGHSK